MTNVEIYTKATCPYCIKAKGLLKKKGVKYMEHKVDNNEDLRNAMINRANGKSTVPQIFINDKHIGGCDDLHALESKGELNKLLSLK